MTRSDRVLYTNVQNVAIVVNNAAMMTRTTARLLRRRLRRPSDSRVGRWCDVRHSEVDRRRIHRARSRPEVTGHWEHEHV